jgi:predicted DNA-binding mobile mystery protein A
MYFTIQILYNASVTEVARRHLDARFTELRPMLPGLRRPHTGWIRAIRDGLGMSARELGDRMGVTQQAVGEIERSEAVGTIRFETLVRVADALNCDVAYVLVPRQSLHEAVHGQARKRAAAYLRGISHHSRLEDQVPSDADAEAQVSELAQKFVDRRGLWTDV